MVLVGRSGRRDRYTLSYFHLGRNTRQPSYSNRQWSFGSTRCKQSRRYSLEYTEFDGKRIERGGIESNEHGYERVDELRFSYSREFPVDWRLPELLESCSVSFLLLF